jgi:hypothetical protein
VRIHRQIGNRSLLGVLLALIGAGCRPSALPEEPRAAGAAVATPSASADKPVEVPSNSLSGVVFTTPPTSDPPVAPVPAAVVLRWPEHATVEVPGLGPVQIRDTRAFVTAWLMPLIERRFSPVVVVSDLDAAPALGPHAEIVLELRGADALSPKGADGEARRGVILHAEVKVRKAGMSGWNLSSDTVAVMAWREPPDEERLPPKALRAAFQRLVNETSRSLEDTAVAGVIVDLIDQRAKARKR